MHGQLLPRFAQLWECVRVLAPLFDETTEVRDVQSQSGKQESFVPEIRKLFLFSSFPDSISSIVRVLAPLSQAWHVCPVRMLIFLLLAIAPISIFAAPKTAHVPQLTGYKAVRVHYAPLNEMIMFVNINGRPARLLVDTGSNQTMLNADAAESFGIYPSQRGFHYIRFTQVNGEVLPVGFAQSLTADGMNLGGSPVTLRRAISSGNRNADVDGLLGLNILYRHKAVINCRTKLVFFKIDQARQINLGAVAASENFTRVPLRREENGALTVQCSIQGQPAHMLVDTGSFLTTFNEGFLKALGLALNPTRVSAHFSSGVTRRMSAAAINDLKIGEFKVPQKKFGVTALPHFTLHQAGTTISGILGIETLYNCHAILDLEGMNLFLK
jgi:predicted aspartyl protease